MFPIRASEPKETDSETNTDAATETDTTIDTAVNVCDSIADCQGIYPGATNCATGQLGTSVCMCGSALCVDTLTGLMGNYFRRYNFDDFITCKHDATIDFDWTTTPPDGISTVDGMSVRWEGHITPTFSETYTFETIADDGSRLWVDDTLIIDDWLLHRAESQTGSIGLKAGEPTTLVLEYFNAFSLSSLRLGWSSPSVPSETIPASAFTSTECGNPPPPVAPPTPILGTCLTPDDFNDSVLGTQWNSTALQPLESFGVLETGAIEMSVVNGYRFDGPIDVGALLFQPTEGDVDVSFKVTSIEDSYRAEMGLMMRDSAESDGKSVFIGFNSELDVYFVARQDVGEATNALTTETILAFPYWVRLGRIGDTFSGYTSADGISWQLVNTTEVSMSNSYYVGIAQSSGTANQFAVGTGDDFAVLAGECP